MRNEKIENNFKEKLYECNKHIEKIEISKKYLAPFMPLDTTKYLAMDEIALSFVDRLIYRFSKLQDTIGEKLFPSLLELIGEEVKSKPFIDRLNRIDELGILHKNEWMELRKDRNELAYEYSFNVDEVVDCINVIFIISQKLLSIYEAFYNYCQDRFDFVRNSEVLKQGSK